MKNAIEFRCKQLITNTLLLVILNCQFLIFNSCDSKPPQYDGAKTRFFDLKGFLKKEISGHLATQKKVKKTVTVNGQTETKEVVITDWETELDPFFKSDINRPAWSDFYLVKESPIGNHGKISEYYALKDHLKTRSMRVSNFSDLDVQIDILNADKSIATATQTRLVYDGNRGYKITTYQNLLGGRDSIQIEGTFLK